MFVESEEKIISDNVYPHTCSWLTLCLYSLVDHLYSILGKMRKIYILVPDKLEEWLDKKTGPDTRIGLDTSGIHPKINFYYSFAKQKWIRR